MKWRAGVCGAWNWMLARLPQVTRVANADRNSLPLYSVSTPPEPTAADNVPEPFNRIH